MTSILTVASAEGFSGLETLSLADDGLIPNSALPVLIYRGVLCLGRGDTASRVQALFAGHGWGGGWVDGIFDHHHYHSTAHEVLGISRGWAEVQLGGNGGVRARIAAGDVVVLPAGTGHKNLASGDGLQVVGAYPAGQSPDMCRDDPADRATALAKLARVGLPPEDPVFGAGGPLVEQWARR